VSTDSSQLDSLDVVHRPYLDRAFQQALIAESEDEVPVGAVIVRNGDIIAEAYNQKERSHKITAHAEVLAIQKAIDTLGDWRLTDCTLYTTLEPCPMCAGAILLARVGVVVYAERDPKFGALESQVMLFQDTTFNHHPEVLCVYDSRSSAYLKRFFQQKRA
tara:strand:+ start:58 stop:540 length:483 start_codon:yes stop_codon:yes gene_type:complete